MLGRGLESLIPHKNHAKDEEAQVYNDDNQINVDKSNDVLGYQNNDSLLNEEFDKDNLKESDKNGLSEEDGGVYNVNDSLFNNVDDIADNLNDSDVSNPNVVDNKKDDNDNNEIQDTILSPVFRIEIESIVPNPYQPRKFFNEASLGELSVSIRELGILQPLVVAKIVSESEFGTNVKYQLIAGHRRLMAAKMLGMKSVPAIIREPKRKTEMLEMAVVENIQRANLNVIETARAFARLSDEFGLTQREISVRLGKSREFVANALRLLGLPSIVQDAVAEGKITESHARILMQIEDAEMQKSLFFRIISEQLSVRGLKNRIQNTNKKSIVSGIQPQNVQNIQMQQIEKTLSEFLGAPVKVDFSDRGGKIVIHFYSPEEARGIVHRITPEDEF